jgi:hypothetical protein
MRLLCIGDIAISGRTTSSWFHPMGTTPKDEARVLFNWELPIGEMVNPIPRTSGPRLLSHPESVNVILKWAPGYATLATNHILDAGEKGLAATIDTLHQAGFQTVGAGQYAAEVQRPIIWKAEEGRLAMVNWVFPETHPDWRAIPGPNCWPGIEEAESVISELKRKVDWVIVLAHWSDELFSYPRPEDRLVAHELAQIGADMVIGHHPHVVRGMEVIGHCPVFYSIGNYFFSDQADTNTGRIVRQAPRNRESLGIYISFRQGMQPEIRVSSFWQKRESVESDPLKRAVRRMKSVSRPLQQFNDARYADWYAVKRARFNSWEYRLQFRLWQLGILGLTKYLFQQIKQKNDGHTA